MTFARPLAAVALLAALATAPALASTSWSTPAGSSNNITYSGGQTSNGLLTSTGPTVGGDSFLFFPSKFSSTDNSSANDTASFLVTAKTGRQLSSISAGLNGDWSILGNGTTDATGTLTLTNPFTSAIVTQTFNFAGQLGTSDGDGTFRSQVVTLPLGWKSAQVSLSAGLTSTTEQGSTSFVQFKGGSVHVETAPQAAAVPLPPALLAAIPGVAVAYLARRKLQRA